MDLNGQKIQVGTAGSPLHSWGGGQQTKAVWPKGLSWWIIHFFPDTIEPWETPCWLVVLEDCTYYLVQLGLCGETINQLRYLVRWKKWGNFHGSISIDIFLGWKSPRPSVFLFFFLHRPLSGIGRWWSDFGGTGTCGGSTTGNCLVLGVRFSRTSFGLAASGLLKR